MYSPFVSNIADIEIIDDSTVQFHLNAPSAAFLTASLSKLNLIPQHIWAPVLEDLATRDEENAEDYQEEIPIGSGPFQFSSWLTNEEIVLEANADHFSAPNVDRWILRIVPNTEASLGMLRSGEINFLSDYPGDPNILIEIAGEDGDLEVVSTVDMGFRYVAFNHRRPPFSDPAFRQALSMAINRDLIVGAAFRGFAVPSNSVISPALAFWHNDDVDEFETGVEVAQAILADAGYEVIDGRLHYPDGVSETLGE